MSYAFPALKYMFNWNMQMRIINIIIIAIIWGSYLRSRRLKLRSRTYFMVWLLSCTVQLILDVVAAYGTFHSDIINPELNIFIHRIYFISKCGVMACVYLYLLSMESRVRSFFSLYTLFRCFPLIVCALAVFKSGYSFYLAEDGAYITGQIIKTTDVCVLVYFALSVIVAVRNFKNWSREQSINIFLGFFIWILFYGIRYINHYIIHPASGLVFMLLLNYLVFEDGKAYINYENGIFNAMAYRLALNEKFKTEGEFKVYFVTFSEFAIVHGRYGHDVCQKILKGLAKIIESNAKAEVYSIEEESLAFILDSGSTITDNIINMLLEKTEYNWNYNENTIHITGQFYEVKCPQEASDIVELDDMYQFMKSIHAQDKRWIQADARLMNQRKRYDTIVQMLEHAIYNDGFEMVYQPIYSTKDKSFHSAEALIRLKDTQTLGFVSPEEFITIAEKEGMIMMVGDIVLNKVCSFAKANHLIEKGIRYIEINLSGIQCIDQGLPKQIEEVVQKYKLPFNFLNLEITETAAVESGEMLNLNMDKLTGKGVAFSMDDFGTGYSNLAKMAEVSYDLIKIDKSLIWYCYPKQRQILKKDETNPDEGLEKSKVVLAKVIKMITELNLKIVAEGVETKEMVEMLTDNGVDYLQGYYYSKPLSEKDYINFLTMHK